MTQNFQFAGPGRDSVDVQRVEDAAHGPVLWLQSGFDGCYIPVDRLDEFIAGLKTTAATETADSNAA